MQLDALRNAKKYSKAHRQKRWWYRIMVCLAAIVVFSTTYALILPAITLESGTICGLETHTHTDSCYTLQTVTTVREPVCTPERLGLHQHTPACYDEYGELVCGYGDFVVHTHDANCYTGDGKLWCPLPEIQAHTHGADCCRMEESTASEPHVHTGECYMPERGKLICTLSTEPQHTHSDACYQETADLVCGLSESEGHTHGVECYDENGGLICGQEEFQGHHHDQSCYETKKALICELTEEPGHQHTDECYEWERILICTLSTQTAQAEPSRPERICGREEIILHTHTSDCYNGSGALICGMQQVLAHQHTDTCFATVEKEADTETLTCALPENENHTHTARCYGTWELTCGKEEHTHTEACYPKEESEEEPEVPSFCGWEAHSHDESCYDETGALLCSLEVHVHTLACFSDPGADVETAEIWENSIAGAQLTGQWRQDVIAIARTQLGYTESTANYAVREDGSVHGYTRYGGWYGSPYGDWDAMFASFCIHYAGVEEMPMNRGCRPWITELEELGLYRSVASGYVPSAGDLIFCDGEQDGLPDHVGLVAEMLPASEGPAKLMAIEGNSGGQVQYVTYELDSPVILGYGLLPEQNTEQTLTAAIYCDSTYTQLQQDDSTVITVSGVLPPDAEVRAYPIAVEVENHRVLAAYDITVFLADGSVYELQTPLKVHFDLPELLELDDGGALSVVYVPEDGGEPEQMESEQDGDGISFEAPHFSGFAVLLADGGCACTIEGCDLDSALGWVSSSDQNPFGGAINYNLFLFGNLENWNDVEGNVALQGDLTVRNGGMTYPEGATNTSTGVPIPRFRVGLLLGGDVTDGLTSVNVLNGNVICSGELDAVKFGLHTTGDHVHGTDAAMISAFFEAAKADLTGRNAAIYSKTSNGTVTENTDGTVTMTGTDPFLNVFTMTPSQYAAAVQGSEARRVYLDVPYGSYVIINIAGSGTVTDFAPGLLTKNSSGEWVDPSKNSNDDQAQSQRILFNFSPDITQVNLTTGFYLYGSVLAPNLFWKIDSNVYVGVDGTTVLARANGGGTASEFHYNPYVPPGAASLRKTVACDTEEHSDCITLPENTYVKVTLEEVVDKLGSHAVYELEFMLSKTYQIPAISPGKYRVSEVAFYTMDESGETQDVVIAGHSFTGATFKINGQEASSGTTVTIYSGSNVTIEVTNHYKEGEYTSIAVQKKWVDADGNQIVIQDDTQIAVQLYQATDRVLSPDEGTPFGDPVTLTAADGWYYQWTELPKNDESGHSYWYFVRETSPVEGFDVEYESSDNGYDPIQSGTYTLINKKKTEVTVNKIWKDSSGNEIEPPEGTTIEVTLYGNSKVVTQDAYGQSITNPVTLSSAEGWEHTWENLCLRDPDDISGNAINYTVTESGHPDSYTSVVTGSGYRFTITNTKKPAYEMTVSKVWTDENGSPLSGTALPAVKVQLYQLIADWSDGTADSILKSGTAYGNPVWLSGENGWSYTWEELPKTDGDKQCYYAVKELSNIPGFTTTNSDPNRNADAGTISQTITNRRDEKLTGIALQKQWQDIKGNYTDPPEGAAVSVQLYQQKGTVDWSNTVRLNVTTNGNQVAVLEVLQNSTVTIGGTFWAYGWNPAQLSAEGASDVSYEKTGREFQRPGTASWDPKALEYSFQATLSTMDAENTCALTVSSATLYTDEDHGVSVWINDTIPGLNNILWETGGGISYGDPIVLNNENGWFSQKTDLPAMNADRTEFYRYYALEVAGLEGYTVSYCIGGKNYTVQEGASPVSMDGITEGSILITNTSTRAGVELPDTGGAGTALYTFSGIALMAGTLMYFIRKRRKGAV